MSSRYKRQRFERPREQYSCESSQKTDDILKERLLIKKDFDTQSSKELRLTPSDCDDVPILYSPPPTPDDDFWWFVKSLSEPEERCVSILGCCGRKQCDLPPPPPNTLRIFLNSKKDDMHHLNILNVRPAGKSSTTLWNMWQFSMVYPSVYPLSIVGPSSEKPLWLHEQYTMHLDTYGTVLPAFWQWRKKGWATRESILQPNGPFHTEVGAHYCLWPKDSNDINETDVVDPDGNHYRRYFPIASRYLLAKEYIKAVQEIPAFTKLKALVESSPTTTNIQLVDRHFPSPDQIRAHARKAGIFLLPEDESMRVNRDTIVDMIYAHQLRFSYTLILAALLSGLESVFI